ncbi:MAG: ABC transporter ATP-binding protein [Methanocellales archaeon]
MAALMQIELRNVSFRYEGSEKYALKNINLKIKKSEIIAIAGKNGSGKTTLAKLILGLLKPESGEIYIEGELGEKSRIGLVFQNPLHQFFCDSVGEEVAFGLKNLGLPKNEVGKRVNALLKQHGLFNQKEKHPFALSEGEKKTLALASILAMDPDFLILDEPTLGQDLLHQERLKALLKNLANGKGIIIISHDLEFISDIAQRVVLMQDGEILADGKAEEILFDEQLLERCGLTMPLIPMLVKKLSLNPTLSEEEILTQLIKLRGASKCS